jgi:replicative DNA helicase
MPLLKDSIRIVTTPPTPQAQLAAVVRELRAERARLARILNNLLQIMNKLSPDDVFVLKQEANSILLELDLLLDKLTGGGGRG